MTAPVNIQFQLTINGESASGLRMAMLLMWK
jgi:hypothetical protein